MEEEPIRLVIWDLDDTFWRGSILEGGVQEYLSDNHDIVVELAHRGIISSICSNNDRAPVEAILRELGIWQYFVFSSINWGAKGQRLHALVASMKLRPSTVLFLDDNPTNRAEAIDAVPGINVETPDFIFCMLGDQRFSGTPDPALSRLSHYKALEQRQQHKQASGTKNDAFLRSSEIQVKFDFDISANIDRAVELIARTNQLNFTKVPPIGDPQRAASALLAEAGRFWRQAALIRVVDRFGDHGYCGFFLLENYLGGGTGRLIHYCFSCRIIGLGVEQWVYSRLGEPRIDVMGPVASDIRTPSNIDWIKLASSFGMASGVRRLPEVRLRGGCEVDALAHYFGFYTDRNRREGNLIRRPFFVSRDCPHHIAVPEDNLEETFLKLAETCGFDLTHFDSMLFEPCASGSLIVVSTWGNINSAYRHRETGRLLTVDLPGLSQDVSRLSNQEIDSILTNRIERKFNDAERGLIHSAVAALKTYFDFVASLSEWDVKEHLRRLFSALPHGCRVAVLAMDEFRKEGGGSSNLDPKAVTHNRWLADISAQYHAKVFYVGDYIASEAERDFTGHFHRIVYFRLASAILEWALSTDPLHDHLH